MGEQTASKPQTIELVTDGTLSLVFSKFKKAA